MEYTLRDFTKLCKSRNYLKTDDVFRMYYRIYKDALLQVICIYRQPGYRKYITFGCYTLYGKVFAVIQGTPHLPSGNYTTASLAQLMGLAEPQSLEEDFLFMEQYGLPFLDSIQTQRDLIDAETARGTLFPNGLTPWNLNICGAHLYENEKRIALERVSLILAQNISAFISNMKWFSKHGIEEDFAVAWERWIEKTASVRDCYAAATCTSNSAERIKQYLENCYTQNMSILMHLS